MFADLQGIRSEFKVVIDEHEDRCKRPDDTPHRHIAELRDEFGIVGWSSARQQRLELTEQRIVR